jgi:hypothetical protein
MAGPVKLQPKQFIGEIFVPCKMCSSPLCDGCRGVQIVKIFRESRCDKLGKREARSLASLRCHKEAGVVDVDVANLTQGFFCSLYLISTAW